MAPYNPDFPSEQAYNNYLACLFNLKVGDQVVCRSSYEIFDGIFLNKELRRSNGGYNFWDLLLGTEEIKSGFYNADYITKRDFLLSAKKENPKIRITKLKIRWTSNNNHIKITKIIKRNEEKEKKEKIDKKSLRTLGQNEKFWRDYKASINPEKGRQKQAAII